MIFGGMLFLFAAAGGIQIGGLSLKLNSSGSQLLLSAMGLLIMASGVLLLADRGKASVEVPRPQQAKNLGDLRIKMLRPIRFQRYMQVEGGCLNLPAEGTLRLFTVHDDGRFRPQSIAQFDQRSRRWSAEVDLGPGPYYSVYVVAALVEKPGISLWDYFFQVGAQTEWELVAGGFGEYAVECDRFLVEGVINGE
jgi:hypothetical protein